MGGQIIDYPERRHCADLASGSICSGKQGFLCRLVQKKNLNL